MISSPDEFLKRQERLEYLIENILKSGKHQRQSHEMV